MTARTPVVASVRRGRPPPPIGSAPSRPRSPWTTVHRMARAAVSDTRADRDGRRSRGCRRGRSCWCGRRATSPGRPGSTRWSRSACWRRGSRWRPLLLVPLTRWRRGPLRIGRPALLRVCAVGLVMNAVQFGLMYLAFEAGLGATLGALLHSLSPVLTVVLAGLLLARAGAAGCRCWVWRSAWPASSWCSGRTSRRPAARSGIVCGLLGHAGAEPRHHGPALDPGLRRPVVVGEPPVRRHHPDHPGPGLVLEGTQPVHDPVGAAVALVFLAVVNSIVGLILLGVVVRAAGPVPPRASSSCCRP